MSGVERGQGVALYLYHGFHAPNVWLEEVGFSDSMGQPGRWFPTDEASLTQMRERLEHLVQDHEGGELQESDRQLADAVMRLLFGQDGEGT